MTLNEFFRSLEHGKLKNVARFPTQEGSLKRTKNNL